MTMGRNKSEDGVSIASRSLLSASRTVASLEGAAFLNAPSTSHGARFAGGDAVDYGAWLLDQVRSHPGRLCAMAHMVLSTGPSERREVGSPSVDFFPLPVGAVAADWVLGEHAWLVDGDGPMEKYVDGVVKAFTNGKFWSCWA